MNGFVIIKAIISQKFGRIFFSPALVVDTKVNASVEGQGDILIQLQAANEGAVKSGPFVRHILRIGGPSFNVTEKIHSLTQWIWLGG